MATVLISERLIADVKSNITRMANAEVTAACLTHGETVTTPCEELFNFVHWGKHLHLRDMMPKDWLSTGTHFTLRVKAKGDLTLSVSFASQPPLYYHPSANTYGPNRNATITEEELAPLTLPGADKVRTMLKDYRTQVEITTRWLGVETDVITFLKKCKSLNEALKLLPNMRLYISKDDLARVDHKQERPKERREKLVSEIGQRADELTAAAMAARLSGVF